VTASVLSGTAPRPLPRFRVFVDYWNLQLSLNARETEVEGKEDVRFKIDWRSFPQWVAQKAADVCGIGAFSYEGGIIYASYSETSAEGRKFHTWATTWLNRQPGIQVQCRARQPKGPPKCPACHYPIEICPRQECGVPLARTVEKGVDTAIATDMIRLAWEDAYEIAVLVSSDADLVPAVEFLNLKGRRIIQAGFPPAGVHLATACWASFDLFAHRDEFRRP
jgi:uncharacterized LabA/DUF88 family protein